MDTPAPPRPPRLVILGAGGLARGVADVVQAVNHVGRTYELLGFLAPVPTPPQIARRRLLVLGDDRLLGSLGEVVYATAVADPRVKRDLAARAGALGIVGATLVHPAASVSSYSELSEGVVLAAGVRVAGDVHVGTHVHLNFNSTVGHDVRIDPFSTVHPQASIGGRAHLAPGVLVGAGAAVLPGILVGEGASIGAGAVVVADVAPHTTVAGVPARPLAGRSGTRAR